MSQNIFSFILFLSLSSFVFSDTSGPETAIIQLDSKNAENYLLPLNTMLGTCMNSGYYRKAAPHKILGFDITVDIAYAMAPSVKTTYDFVIPDESLSYSYQFQFPKSYLMADIPTAFQESLLENIPDANTDESYNNNGLFIDMPISFELPLDKLFKDPDSAPNILGDSTPENLEFDFSVADEELFNQIINGIWLKAKNIDGIGQDYNIYDKGDDDRLIYKVTATYDSASFRNNFAEQENIYDTIESNLKNMNVTVPVPQGFGHLFNTLPFANGLPLPIIQASVGLPYHTEITVRGLPEIPIASMGTIQYGGFGGKVGISEYLNDILYPNRESAIYELDIPLFSYTKIINFTQAQPTDIDSMDVEQALAELRLYNIDTQEIDSLSFLFTEGDSMSVVAIQGKIQRTMSQLQSKPKSYKKTKKQKFPIDLALGYYASVYTLNMDGPMINSTNHILSIQTGKTFNLPFVGGLGIYGGIGFESSNLDLSYKYTNPLGESMDMSLSLSGNNIFRSTIGARIRILLFDVYVDYNLGTSNTVNAGFGVTFR